MISLAVWSGKQKKGLSTLQPSASYFSVITSKPQNYRWQNIKEYKGKMNWTLRVCCKYIKGAQIASVLSWGAGTAPAHPPTTPIPHTRPGVGNGVVGGCAIAVHSSFFIAAILHWEKDDVGFILCYSIIYNSVSKTYKIIIKRMFHCIYAYMQ